MTSTAKKLDDKQMILERIKRDMAYLSLLYEGNVQITANVNKKMKQVKIDIKECNL